MLLCIGADDGQLDGSRREIGVARGTEGQGYTKCTLAQVAANCTFELGWEILERWISMCKESVTITFISCFTYFLWKGLRRDFHKYDGE